MGHHRIMIAATQSGVGKTTFSIALTRALVRRGLKVATFKAGPDFLDPTHLALAAGTPCYNLDTWMMGKGYVKSLLVSKSQDADISLIEGVMGLFDGAMPDANEGSSAEIAAVTKTPVLLLVNARGMSRSIAALVRGYCEFEAGIRIKGVIANQVGSADHFEMLSKALRASGLPKLVGAIPRGAFPTLPERHLGLVTANEEILAEKTLDALADTLLEHVNLEWIIDISKKAGALKEKQSTPPATQPAETIRLAVAMDEAFHFYYQDTLDVLWAAGFKLVKFSPLKDRAVPESVDGLFLGGGYPEIFAAELSRNAAMRESVRGMALSGMPVYAECGGLMYLSEQIKDTHGNAFEMCNVFPFVTQMLNRRKYLGYVEVQLTTDSLWGEKGATLRGHEFHYSELKGDAKRLAALEKAYKVKRLRTGDEDREGFRQGNVLASYIHLHFASRPETVAWFYNRCAKFKERE